MTDVKGFVLRFVPRFDTFKLVLILIVVALNVTFLSTVLANNEFSLLEPLVASSFFFKIVFDVALVLMIVYVMKGLFRVSWPAAIFLVVYLLLSIANILLYHFGNTMVEGHHLSMIEPYALMSYLPWWGLLLILAGIAGSFFPFWFIVRGIDSKDLLPHAAFLAVVMSLVGFLNGSGLIVGKTDDKHDRIITGFRNAQIYYATKNQVLSVIKDVAFPALGQKLRFFTPETEAYVDDYNLISDHFELASNLSAYKRTIADWGLPFDAPPPPPTGLKPFTRVIHVFTESLSLDALPCHNERLGVEFATGFFCRKDILDATFSNLYTTGSPTLQGLTVTFDGHPNYMIQEQTGHPNSVPKLLMRNGFKTVFIRSASKYFANENRVFRNMGFSEIIGREDFYDIPALRKFIYGWGLEDRILYDKVVEYIERNRDKKLFVAVLGTDTHPPTGQVQFRHLRYPPRPELRKKVPRETFDWLNAIDRMNFDIGQFVAELDRKGLFDEHTLIIVSSDHSCAINNVTGKIPGHARTNLGRIPVVFLSRQRLPEARHDMLASAIDIAPTVFHLLGLPRAPGWWGRSLFDPARREFAVGFDKGFVRFVDADRDVLINTDEPSSQAEKDFLDLFYTVCAPGATRD